MNVVRTSLSDRDRLPLGDERLAYVAMIADGVGGSEGGEQASATALETATEYVVRSMDCYYSGNSGETDFIHALEDAAMSAHQAVLQRARSEPDKSRMATTLTLWMGVWPWYYLLQVGDSRYYMFRDGKLTQVSRDQTIAQELVDQGILTRTAATRTQFAHVLSSALGGEQAAPVVTRLQAGRNITHLICSDGLTKHVSDSRIAERLAHMTSAKQVCEQLLQDALDGGGTDNVTIIVGRVKPEAAQGSPSI